MIVEALAFGAWMAAWAAVLTGFTSTLPADVGIVPPTAMTFAVAVAAWWVLSAPYGRIPLRRALSIGVLVPTVAAFLLLQVDALARASSLPRALVLPLLDAGRAVESGLAAVLLLSGCLATGLFVAAGAVLFHRR